MRLPARSVKFVGVAAFGAALVAAAALMPPTPIALSAACCENFLSEIVYFDLVGNKGVPPYTMNEGGMRMESFMLEEGDSFSVTDHDGATETVTFTAAQFADLEAATMDEVMDAVNDQLSIGRALMDSGMLMLRGAAGGAGSELTLVDGAGAPLAELGFAEDTMMGAEDIELALATHFGDMGMGGGMGDGEEGGAELMHLPYLVAMSATPGSTTALGHEIPLAIDNATHLGLRATQFGLLPGFVGELDHGGAAMTAFDTALLPKMFPGGHPERLYFAFVVFSEDLSEIVYVSNGFQVEIVD
ncbi:MAG: hypothetical protein ACT4PU_06730 [Planctomycetota bacterium]